MTDDSLITTRRAPNAHERADDAPLHSLGTGMLALLCGDLKVNECLEIVITRQPRGVLVVVTLPNGTVKRGTGKTPNDALWVLR